MLEQRNEKQTGKTNCFLHLTYLIIFLIPFNLIGQVKWTYTIKHLKMPTTKLTFTFRDTIIKNESEYFELFVTAKNQNIFNFLFRVENEYRTQIQNNTFLPLRMEKKINQKNIEEQTVIIYDQASHLAYKDSSFSWTLPVACHNYFSMLFFLRNQPLHPGDCYTFNLDVEYLTWEVEACVQQLEAIELDNRNDTAIRVDLNYKSLTNDHKRPWKTDLLTNRIARKGGKMVVWFGSGKNRPILRVNYDKQTFMILTDLTPLAH